ncbi:hypothetical protein E2C01_082166 [Portunus trituberculatus]|uniref:Uncharacterized protein n=1 Tax=Portunus trituberculatus TaxID=210409 RepID=A0A5B7J309_PORTR|nr:hypothetical protein [Portunus trituberculatus]
MVSSSAACLMLLYTSPHPMPRGSQGCCKCVRWGPRGLQAHGFKSCPRSECRLGFLTRGSGLLAGGL